MDIITQCQRSKEPDSIENLEKIKICIYLDALINFLKSIKTQKQSMRLVPFSSITEKVETHIRKNFSQPDTIKM